MILKFSEGGNKTNKRSQEKLLRGILLLLQSLLKIKSNSKRRRPYPDRLHQSYHAQTSLWMFSFLFFLPSFELGILKEPLGFKFTNSAPALSAGPHNGHYTAKSNSKAQEVKVLILESPRWP